MKSGEDIGQRSWAVELGKCQIFAVYNLAKYIYWYQGYLESNPMAL